MTVHINISAGEMFELIRPSFFIIAAGLSVYVLISGRRRFRFVPALLWTIGVLILPLVVFPLYLLVVMLLQPTILAQPDVRRRWLVPLVYALLLSLFMATYFYISDRRVDAYLARANHARVNNDRQETIRQLRAALALEDNAHTHKLLALELKDAGEWRESLSEFRLAENGGEPDALIHYWLGALLEHLKLDSEARMEYEEFLESELCVRELPDQHCQDAQQRIDLPGQ